MKTTNDILTILKNRVNEQDCLIEKTTTYPIGLDDNQIDLNVLSTLKYHTETLYKAQYMKILCNTLIERIESDIKEFGIIKNPYLIIDSEIYNIDKFLHSRTAISSTSNQMYNLCSIWEWEVKITFQDLLAHIIKN